MLVLLGVLVLVGAVYAARRRRLGTAIAAVTDDPSITDWELGLPEPTTTP